MTVTHAAAPRPSTSLLTDMYELTMLQGALRSGTAGRRSVFELFGRRLPASRRYGVVAGTGRLLDAVEAFTFTDEQIDFLHRTRVVDDTTLDYLRGYRFSGTIRGYAEGECYFEGSPLLTVEGTFAEACILETLALSVYNYDCAVAAAASRITIAAHGRPCVDFGARRAHEQAAVAAARAAGGELGAVRLDSGDLVAEAFKVRAQLDALGSTGTRITVTNDLDEYAIAALGTAPVDSYGVGTKLVTGSGRPTAALVYKLVEREGADGQMAEVAKFSEGGKSTVGGRKWAGRVRDESGSACEELIVSAASEIEALCALEDAGARPLQVTLVEQGRIVEEHRGAAALAAAAERHRASRAELPYDAWRLSEGEAAVPTHHVDLDGRTAVRH